jgi:hypothetical protein
MSDADITASDKPTIFASVSDVFVAKVLSDYDQVVDGVQDGTPDVVEAKESDGTTSKGYYANIDGASGVDLFTGSSDANFDSTNMTLEKALLASEVVTDGSLTDTDADSDGLTDILGVSVDTGGSVDYNNHLIYDAHELLDVFTVTNSTNSEVDTLIGIEELEFNDGTIDLTPQSETSVTFSIELGVTEIKKIVGSQFSDQFQSTPGTEIFSGGAGKDTITLGDGSGTDRVTDFNVSKDTIEILKDVNDTSITAGSSALSRVTDTSDGALINLGYSGIGVDQELHTILLEGVSTSDLSASNFSVVEIL